MTLTMVVVQALHCDDRPNYEGTWLRRIKCSTLRYSTWCNQNLRLTRTRIAITRCSSTNTHMRTLHVPSPFVPCVLIVVAHKSIKSAQGGLAPLSGKDGDLRGVSGRLGWGSAGRPPARKQDGSGSRQDRQVPQMY